MLTRSVNLQEIHSMQDDLTPPCTVLITDQGSSNTWTGLSILLRKSMRLYIY